MPRGVASIDPQDFPCPPLPAVPPPPQSRWVRSPAATDPTTPPRSSPPLLYRSLPPDPRFIFRPSVSLVVSLLRIPLRRPGYPSWFTSLFTISLALSRVSRNRAPTSPPTSLFRRCEPHHRRFATHHHPAAAAARHSVTSSFDRGRCLEPESRRVRQIRRTFAGPGLDPSATLRMEIKAGPLKMKAKLRAYPGLLPLQKMIALNFCRDPISLSAQSVLRSNILENKK